MKLFSKLCTKSKEQATASTSVEQQGGSPISVIGNVSDSFIGCTIINDDIAPLWKDRLDTYIATLQRFKPQTAK
ncbi:hypothetical protein AGMMS49982_24200 [Bacteroidia bacterium]|nr:hypothetical protein AGMMS49982_24200 [Bacteroidia bacterium]